MTGQALAETARRFGALYTGAITDVLDRLGHLAQTLPWELEPLRQGMRLAGPAFPIRGRRGAPPMSQSGSGPGQPSPLAQSTPSHPSTLGHRHAGRDLDSVVTSGGDHVRVAH